MSAEASGQALKMLLKVNARTERSAMLYSASSPTAVMQFVRIVREAANPNRRLFGEVTSLAAWLDELLTPEESAELHRFLAT